MSNDQFLLFEGFHILFTRTVKHILLTLIVSTVRCIHAEERGPGLNKNIHDVLFLGIIGRTFKRERHLIRQFLTGKRHRSTGRER